MGTSLVVTGLLFDLNFMYDSYIAMSVGIIYLFIARSDLIKEMFMGGFSLQSFIC